MAEPQCEARGSARPSVLHLMLPPVAKLAPAYIGSAWRDTETLCAESDCHSFGAAAASNPRQQITLRGRIRADPSARAASGSKRANAKPSMASNNRVIP